MVKFVGNVRVGGVKAWRKLSETRCRFQQAQRDATLEATRQRRCEREREWER